MAKKPDENELKGEGSETEKSEVTDAIELEPDSQNIKVKLLTYLLDPAHPVGKEKAAYFQNIGYTRENWEELAKQLVFDIKIAKKTVVTEHGQKYNQLITVKIPNSTKTKVINTAWLNPFGTNKIFFITSTPAGKNVSTIRSHKDH